MHHTTPTPEDDNAPPVNANASRALRQGSGLFEIDVRDGFERTVRVCVENALTCYREAAEARAVGGETEAWHLIEIAEQSLGLARHTLCQIEGLDAAE